MLDGVDLASAERLTQARRFAPLATPQDASKYVPADVQISADRVSVKSDYFFVTGRLRLDEHVLSQRSLLRRRTFNIAVIDTQTVAADAQGLSP